jgi:hypothetical protein
VGFCTRTERLLVLIAGLVLHRVTPALAILAAATAASTAQRLRRALA